ncbi:MAG: HNH endonuclease [Pseudomonadota bacterium]|uniref:HNH endonuclease n=1 Tax=Methylophaga aminisulfidivorans TaxID=230105 RepID=UPI0024E25C25|nr:HNH endonuclease [Methylophaga aminisulfidivorans]MEC9413087.1 HNH endonuclease [Pseudomonadota bacterium]
MRIIDKYLEALKTFDDWVIVSDWAKKFGEMYPDLLEKAELEAANQLNDTTGIREIAARISSALSRGAYDDLVEIDTSDKPKRVRFVPEPLRQIHQAQEIEEDIAPLKRDDIIKQSLNTISTHERYRLTEFENIAKQLKAFFGLDFEVDHAKSLLNASESGQHHPDNLQLLLRAHNARKSNENWTRFSIDEQISYITTAIKLQELVADKFQIHMEHRVLDSLIDRLKSIY